MRTRFMIGIAVVCLTMAGCVGGSDGSGITPAAATAQVSAGPTDAQESVVAPATELIGSWHRAQTCAETLAALESAGLAESHLEWLQGNFYGGAPGPSTGEPCAGARGPLEHDHFFTDTGGFGSHDENGEQVDEGDFVVVDDHTLSFPSHATEFGYDGDLLVGYAIRGDRVEFNVVLPATCVEECADAYAWALSAFASGPWARGEVP